MLLQSSALSSKESAERFRLYVNKVRNFVSKKPKEPKSHFQLIITVRVEGNRHEMLVPGLIWVAYGVKMQRTDIIRDVQKC